MLCFCCLLESSGLLRICGNFYEKCSIEPYKVIKSNFCFGTKYILIDSSIKYIRPYFFFMRQAANARSLKIFYVKESLRLRWIKTRSFAGCLIILYFCCRLVVVVNSENIENLRAYEIEVCIVCSYSNVTTFAFGNFMIISGHFFTNYMNIFHET